MKTKKDHRKILIKHYKELLKEYDSIFKLKMKMIDENICPRCGTKSRGGPIDYAFPPCDECDFKLTDWELNQIEDGGKKGILYRKLKKKTKKGFIPSSKFRVPKYLISKSHKKVKERRA